ncbi:unnamed protein product [Caenorhabditis angaria]|uniref:Uncharacterized protein n=1 Tax=Caenorhabditis angaria TaxID=860376 RepID=A0A9P1IHA6_9PELO|nr:unnamed protein product [Caenorhabditis angaria]
MPATRSPSPDQESEKDAQSIQQRSSTSSEAEKNSAEVKNVSLKRPKMEEMCGPMTIKNGKVEESLDPKKDRKIERENIEGINEDDVEFGREENQKETEGEGFDPNAPSSSTAQQVPNVPDSYKYDPEMAKVTGVSSKENTTSKERTNRRQSSVYKNIPRENQQIPLNKSQPLQRPAAPISPATIPESDSWRLCKLLKCWDRSPRRSQSRTSQVVPHPRNPL